MFIPIKDGERNKRKMDTAKYIRSLFS